LPASASELRPEDVVIRSIGAFRERPVELDAVWRGGCTKPTLHRLLRDVLPRRAWITDDFGGRHLPLAPDTAVSDSVPASPARWPLETSPGLREVRAAG